MMAGSKNMSYKSCLETFLKNYFPSEKVDNSGKELVSNLLNDVNTMLISQIEKDSRSISKVNGQKFQHCARKAIEEVFPRDLKIHALSEAYKQLALLESGCIKYKEADLDIDDEGEVQRRGVRKDKDSKTDEGPLRLFRTGITKMCPKVIPNVKVDSKAMGSLAYYIHSFNKIVAERASEKFGKKEELRPADLRQVLNEFLKDNVQKSAHSEGNKSLVLYESGLLEFKPRPIKVKKLSPKPKRESPKPSPKRRSKSPPKIKLKTKKPSKKVAKIKKPIKSKRPSKVKKVSPKPKSKSPKRLPKTKKRKASRSPKRPPAPKKKKVSRSPKRPPAPKKKKVSRSPKRPSAPKKRISKTPPRRKPKTRKPSKKVAKIKKPAKAPIKPKKPAKVKKLTPKRKRISPKRPLAHKKRISKTPPRTRKPSKKVAKIKKPARLLIKTLKVKKLIPKRKRKSPKKRKASTSPKRPPAPKKRKASTSPKRPPAPKKRKVTRSPKRPSVPKKRISKTPPRRKPKTRKPSKKLAKIKKPVKSPMKLKKPAKIKKLSLKRKHKSPKRLPVAKKRKVSRKPKRTSTPKKRPKSPAKEKPRTKKPPEKILKSHSFASAMSSCVLKAFSDIDISLAKDTASKFNQILEETCDVLIKHSVSHCKSKELDPRDIEAALLKLFPPELAAHALSVATNAVSLYLEEMEGKRS